jgi:hypothetical protein
MYTNNTINKIKKIGILLSLILGFMLISSSETSAQYRDDRYSRRDNRDYNNYYGYNSYGSAADIARKYGYQDGLNDGADAAREGDSYHPQNSGDWQKGTNGYESRYGSKGAYKQAYREAYVQGYNAGYQRRNNNNNRARNRYRNY